METQFYLVFNLRNPAGDWHSFGKFFIGNNRHQAKELFRSLQKIPEVQEEYPLCIDFMETKNGLTVNLDVINCTLQQLSENMRIIAKELFTWQLRDQVS